MFGYEWNCSIIKQDCCRVQTTSFFVWKMSKKKFNITWVEKTSCQYYRSISTCLQLLSFACCPDTISAFEYGYYVRLCSISTHLSFEIESDFKIFPDDCKSCFIYGKLIFSISNFCLFRLKLILKWKLQDFLWKKLLFNIYCITWYG